MFFIVCQSPSDWMIWVRERKKRLLLLLAPCCGKTSLPFFWFPRSLKDRECPVALFTRTHVKWSNRNTVFPAAPSASGGNLRLVRGETLTVYKRVFYGKITLVIFLFCSRQFNKTSCQEIAIDIHTLLEKCEFLKCSCAFFHCQCANSIRAWILPPWKQIIILIWQPCTDFTHLFKAAEGLTTCDLTPHRC